MFRLRDIVLMTETRNSCVQEGNFTQRSRLKSNQIKSVMQHIYRALGRLRSREHHKQLHCNPWNQQPSTWTGEVPSLSPSFISTQRTSLLTFLVAMGRREASAAEML